MIEILITALFVWLLVKSVGLVFSLTWGAAKLAAGLLTLLALPVLLVALLFVGGILLLVPIAMLGMAIGIVKACVD